MIIGVCGFIGSGKDTVADYLVNFHEFRRESFANTLKDAVSAVFGWDRTLVEGRTKEAREWREQVDPWWAERLGMPTLTPRWVLQYWGTEVCRKSFHDDIWIASLENKLRSSKDDVIVSDVRFPNEVTAIKNQGGKIVWVQRGRLPEWYESAVQANKGSNLHINEMKINKIHASEWAWVGTEFDHIIENDTSIDDLYSIIKKLIVSS
jgi:hypothetical protein|tara:strand:+ start:5908 stop:6528 length:621 start_codon:yes stop_codon:yes gene_type:complete